MLLKSRDYVINYDFISLSIVSASPHVILFLVHYRLSVQKVKLETRFDWLWLMVLHPPK